MILCVRLSDATFAICHEAILRPCVKTSDRRVHIWEIMSNNHFHTEMESLIEEKNYVNICAKSEQESCVELMGRLLGAQIRSL